MVRDTRLDRVVAIMAPEADVAADRPSKLRQFMYEARVLAVLTRGPEVDIPKLHMVMEHDGRPIFVREFVDGSTLGERLSAGTIGLWDAVRILAAVGRTLSRVHAAGFVHRNLSPSNVLVAADGTAKLIGFGRVGRLQSPQDPAPASADATEEADVRRLQQLPGLACTLVRQPIPPRLEVILLTELVRGAAAFAEELESVAETLPAN
jgi:serine/threonine protein kinase